MSAFADLNADTKSDEEVRIASRIEELANARGQKGVGPIDAVCIVLKAADPRLSPVLSSAFDKILSSFRQNIDPSLFALVTFVDLGDQSVSESLRNSQPEFEDVFMLNNCSLFSKNNESMIISMPQMYWNRNGKLYQTFFDNLSKMDTKHFISPERVLEESQETEKKLSELIPEVKDGLNKLFELKQEYAIIKQHKNAIENNTYFEYEVEEIHQIRRNLPQGEHNTYCLHCHFICHEICKLANDSEKSRCVAMDAQGNCKECWAKCFWTQHRNMNQIVDYVSVKVKKTFKEKMEKYQQTSGKHLNGIQLLTKMSDELDELEKRVEKLIEDENAGNNKLKKLANRQDFQSLAERLDMMINAEKQEQKVGWKSRVSILEEYKAKAESKTTFDKGSQGSTVIRRHITGLKEV